MVLRVLIVEDEVIIARFIEHHLRSNYPELELSICVTKEEVLEELPVFKPDLVLCDIELQEDIDGIDLMKIMRKDNDFAILFITSYQSKHIMNRAFDLAPENYIIKPLDENRLYAGIHPSLKRLQREEQKSKKYIPPIISQLSPQEIQVIKLIAKRLTTKQIAEQLFLSPYTVKNTRHKICRKLNLEEENNALLAWVIHHQDFICEDQ